MELNFDLSLIPSRYRYEFWHDVGSLVHRPIKSGYEASAEVLSVRAKVKLADNVFIGRMAASDQYFERTEKMIKSDLIDSYQLVLLEKGSVHWTAQSTDSSAQEGDILLLDNREISRSEWSVHQQIYVLIPREVLRSQGCHGPMKRVIRAMDPCTEILRQYIKSFWEYQQEVSSETNKKLVQGLASLTRIYFSNSGITCDTETEKSWEPIQDSIEHWISSHLDDPDLDVEQICLSFYISRSKLYELFQPMGGVRSYITNCRLERAYWILTNSVPPISISKIAQQLGFRSLSSFSRSFRDRWGLTPREAIKQSTSGNVNAEVLKELGCQHTKSRQLKEATLNYYKQVSRLSKMR